MKKPLSFREALDKAKEEQAAKDQKKAVEKKEPGHGAWRQLVDAADQQIKDAEKWGRYDAAFGNARIKSGDVTIGHAHLDITTAQVELVQGGQVQRMTATRVLGGAAVGAVTFGVGAVGALIGAMSKKQKAGAWLFILEPGRTPVQLPVKPKEQAAAWQFVNNFQALQAAKATE
jgi:hypothetical protein